MNNGLLGQIEETPGLERFIWEWVVGIMVSLGSEVRGGKEDMHPRITTAIALTKDEIIHIYSGGVLNLSIKGKEAEASIELSCSDATPTRATRIRFKSITAE